MKDFNNIYRNIDYMRFKFLGVNFMLFKTDISIALKNFQGRYDFKKFSLFETTKINESFTSLQVSVINNKMVVIKVKCALCGNNHYYRYNISEFVKKNLIVGGCEVLGFPLFYIGNYDKVRRKVVKHNETNKKMYAMM